MHARPGQRAPLDWRFNMAFSYCKTKLLVLCYYDGLIVSHRNDQKKGKNKIGATRNGTMIRTIAVGVLLRSRTIRDFQIDSTRLPNITKLSVFVFLFLVVSPWLLPSAETYTIIINAQSRHQPQQT
jgi:hypothetical protein